MNEAENLNSRERLENSVRTKYRRVAADPRGLFSYATGRTGALALGYSQTWLDQLPAENLERFVGVGNPFELRLPRLGEHVLDIGCGTGTDVFLASAWVGLAGLAAGLDLTPELLEIARHAARQAVVANIRFEAGSAERLPFADASFDQVVSNGAFNLVVDKDQAFREAARVLRPGGTLAIADLLVVETVPDEVLAGMDAWST